MIDVINIAMKQRERDFLPRLQDTSVTYEQKFSSAFIFCTLFSENGTLKGYYILKNRFDGQRTNSTEERISEILENAWISYNQMQMHVYNSMAPYILFNVVNVRLEPGKWCICDQDTYKEKDQKYPILRLFPGEKITLTPSYSSGKK